MFGFFNYFRVLGSVLLLPLSGWFLMLFAGVIADDVGIAPFGYGTAIVATLGLWLTVAPMGGGLRLGRRIMRKKWMRYAGWMDEPAFGWHHRGDTNHGGDHIPHP